MSMPHHYPLQSSERPPASPLAEGRAQSAPRIRQMRKSRNPLLNMPIARRLTLGFLIPALIVSLALGVIGVQSSQLLSQEALFSQVLLHLSTSLTTSKDLLQQMDTTMQGTLNDAALAQPSRETLAEDHVVVQRIILRINSFLDGEVQQDSLERHADLAALFTQAGHQNQIAEQRNLLRSTLQAWQSYAQVQEQVLHKIDMGDIAGAHALEYSQAELGLAYTLRSLNLLIQFNGTLTTSVRDATRVEIRSLVLIISLATGCALLGIGAIGWLVSSTLVRRLHQLRSVVQSIEQGNLEARMVVVGSDEVATVSSCVNSMLDTIINGQEMEKLHQELQAQHEELNQAHDQLSSANTRLEALATTDVLTELPNHRALVSLIDQELARAGQYERSCSLLFFDIDHFKALNDGYGHAAGDEVLAEFSRLIRIRLREIDTVGRWGGEEFVAILPELTVEQAQAFAETIRVDVAAHTFSAGGGMRLTCSLGVACYPLHAQEREALVTAADQAMYGSKRLGRNQVRSVNDPLVQALLLEQMQDGGREETALAGIIEALSRLVTVHDSSTGIHSNDVGEMSLDLTRQLGLPAAEAHMVALAGHLHDIGKISIPTALLQKPEKLTEEEWVVMRTHPVIGAEVVSSIPALRPLASVIRAHHERWDGQGYPDHLAGDAIPFAARVIAVVEAYLAMTEERPYQPARSRALALAELTRCAGSQFDPLVVAAMVVLQQSDQGMLAVAHVV
ncbi:MAG: diguanylate cyclase [Ktedonobacteraceae bacterium]|nr:diguanylate cyclase [Ktedonobacteraceae bacterium]